MLTWCVFFVSAAFSDVIIIARTFQKQLPKEYTRTQPYRNAVQPAVANKKVEKQPEAEQIIQHVPSMLTEVHPIVANSAKMSYAEASKKSLRTGVPVVSQIVPSENVGWGESDPPLNADAIE
jgi:hypothetical protein